MKIMICQPRVSYYVGGGEKIPLKHAEYLAKLGHEVVIITTKPLPQIKYSHLYLRLKEKQCPLIKFIEIDIPKRFKEVYKIEPGENRNRWEVESLFFGNLTNDYFKLNEPDIVTFYYLTDSIFRPATIPSVCHLLGYPEKLDQIHSAFFCLNDALISISQNVKSKWKPAFGPKTKNYTVLPGTDNDYNKGRFIPLQTKYKLLYAGRLIERKGIFSLLESMENLQKRGINVGLWVAGSGPEEEKIKNIINKKAIRNVILLGSVANLDDYYKGADICVAPSYAKEGLMSVVLEAMYFGCAIITTTGVGNEEVIGNNKRGILVEPGKSNKLSIKIEELIKNEAKRIKVAQEGKKYAEKNFKWEITAEKIAKIYQDVIKNFKRNGYNGS